MICSVCGRILKNPKSAEIGYGPVCYRKMFGHTLQANRSRAESPAGSIPEYDIPGQMTVEEYLRMMDTK